MPAMSFNSALAEKETKASQAVKDQSESSSK